MKLLIQTNQIGRSKVGYSAKFRRNNIILTLKIIEFFKSEWKHLLNYVVVLLLPTKMNRKEIKITLEIFFCKEFMKLYQLVFCNINF